MLSISLKSLIQILISLNIIFIFGCFEQYTSTGTTPTTLPYITQGDFKGIDSAVNLTTGIKISWTQVNSAKNIYAYNIYKVINNESILIASVPPEASYYIDGNVSTGSKYQYYVKAVDTNKKEDTNTKRLTALAWEGLLQVVTYNNTNIKLTYNSSIKGVYLNIYLEGENKSKTLIKSITSSSEFDLGYYIISSWPDGSFLKPGISYHVYAQIGETGQTTTDGNNQSYGVTLKSYGFEDNTYGYPGWKSIGVARAFGNDYTTNTGSQKYANSDSDLISPYKAQVDLGFLPFDLPSSLSTNLYRYTIFRFVDGDTIDTSNVTLTCPSTYTAATSIQPCIVKDNIHPDNDLYYGFYQIHDLGVWQANTTSKPPRYRYTMAIKHLNSTNSVSGIVEKLPVDKIETFSVLIPVPPDHMVLINREAANYEYCFNVIKNSSIDPQNHNRCSSSEVGNIPSNSNPGNPDLNLDNTTFDFGYNLFVDRYPVGCNASESVAANLTSTTNNLFTINSSQINNAVSASVQSSTKTIFAIHNSNSFQISTCLYRKDSSTAFKQPSELLTLSSSDQTTAFQTAFTSKPGYPKFSSDKQFSTELAQAICSNMIDSNYGAKRLPRIREYRAFSAPPFYDTTNNKKDVYYDEVYTTLYSTSTTMNNGGYCSIDKSVNNINQYSISSSNILFREDAASNNFQTYLNTNGVTNITTILDRLGTLNRSYWASFAVSATAGTTFSRSTVGPISFLNGASATARCMSRYGVTEILETSSPVSNYHDTNSSVHFAYYPTSDYYLWSPSTATSGTLTGLFSLLDSGNIEASYNYVQYPTDKVNTGFVLPYSPNASNSNYIKYSKDSSYFYFNWAMGLPISNLDPNLPYYLQYLPSSSSDINYGLDTLAVLPNSSLSLGSYYMSATGRYTSGFTNTSTNSSVNITPNSRIRCVLPAE